MLIVEQDVHSSYILKGILMAAGYRVEVRENPSDALALARQSGPDLVVVAAGPDVSEQLAVIDILRHDPETNKCAIAGLGDASDADSFSSPRGPRVRGKASRSGALSQPRLAPNYRLESIERVARSGH